MLIRKYTGRVKQKQSNRERKPVPPRWRRVKAVYMYNDISCSNVIRHKPRGRLRRIGSAALSICGGLTFTLALTRFISDTAAAWSPTATAKVCFSYPDEQSLPDSNDIGQYLLSQAFFGSDALYFDLGEENTGRTELPRPSTSPDSEGETPEPPIDEPSDGTEPSDDGRLPDGTDIYEYDYSLLPDGQIALLPYDLSQAPEPGELLLSNTTSIQIDPYEYLDDTYPITADIDIDEPLVLILHTHGTEAFVPEGATCQPPESTQRSTDISENIVAVGGVMAELLNEAGIPTIHCEIMHDLESYQNSYNYAADTIQKYLRQYPSIKYVFDVHRDAINRTGGDIVKPVSLIDGRVAAQVMLLVGTNEKGADHPDWNENLTVAVNLQDRLTRSYWNFARPINIRGASFNEQFTPGSLLIEIGSSGNTLSEAKYAAELLTYSIIDMIKENSPA